MEDLDIKKEHLDLSVSIWSNGCKKLKKLYEGISTFEEAHLLSLLAMNNKREEDLVVILPGWNIKMSEEDTKRVLELAEEYKKECQ